MIFSIKIMALRQRFFFQIKRNVLVRKMLRLLFKKFLRKLTIALGYKIS